MSAPRGPFPDFSGFRFSLVPDGVDDCMTAAPFVGLIMSIAPLLSFEIAVQDYVRNEGLYEAIRALNAAVSRAGVRVRDSGLLKSSFSDDLTPYTPEEVWTFNLAVDVVVMLGRLDGLTPSNRASAIQTVQSLDATVATHRWRKEVKKAGAGPQAFRELRARVPEHVPHASQSGSRSHSGHPHFDPNLGGFM
jgi:hypothetical protein